MHVVKNRTSSFLPTLALLIKLGEKIETLSRLRYNLVNVIVPFQIVRNAQTKDFSTVDHVQDFSIYYSKTNYAWQNQ